MSDDTITPDALAAAAEIAERFGLQRKVPWIAMVICRNRAKCIHELVEENQNLNRLFDMQHRRMGKATLAWRDATGREHVSPDLGDLLQWLMERAGIASE